MKHLAALLTFLCYSLIGFAQYFEVGALVGTSGYSGELTEQSISTEGLHSTLGVFGRYLFDERFAVKANLTKYTVSASDADARSLALRERNLSFRSDIVEFGLMGEVNLMKYNIRDNRGSVPYITAGLSYFTFNPQAELNGNWYDLEPLHTEGTGYKTSGIAIPFGIGFKFNVNYRVNFAVEVGYRKTFTDRLDDVSGLYPNITAMRSESLVGSQLSYRTPELTGEFGDDPMGTERGDSGNNDSYYYAGISFSVNLTDKYGLDFDEKYDFLKTEKPELTRKERIALEKKQAKIERKKKLKAHRKKLREARKYKESLKAPTKKRTKKRNKK